MAYTQYSSGCSTLELETRAGVTGDGTEVILNYNNIQYNPLSEYDGSTGRFTPSVLTGYADTKYLIQIQLYLRGMLITNTTMILKIVYDGGGGASDLAVLNSLDVFACSQPGGGFGREFGLTSSVILDLSPGVPYWIVLSVLGNPTPNIDIVGNGGSIPIYNSFSFTRIL